MGHVRLSVIDLSDASSQPFQLLSRYSIVYNGEIFNYRELRAELQALGAVFETDGDTEVVAWAYHFWRERAVTRFNGMWAFGVFDSDDESLFLSRDRFGEKPLYYAEQDGIFIFASEVKSMLPICPRLAAPNLDAIVNYIRTSVGAQHAFTWFKGVFRLDPGCNLFRGRMGTSVRRYWGYPEGQERRVSDAEAIHEYRDLFFDSVRLRLRSDVPVGLTLSSGVDSSSIACVMQRQSGGAKHAFTAGFNPSEYRKSEQAAYSNRDFPIDEAVIAERLCKEIGLESNIVPIDYTRLVTKLTRIVWHLESGNSSPAVVPLMQVMAAAKRKVTVVLEGQGADELLGGYSSAVMWPTILDSACNGSLRHALQHLRGFRDGNSYIYALKIALRNLGNEFPLINSIYQRQAGITAIIKPELRATPWIKDWPSIGDSDAIKNSGRLIALLRRQHAGGLVNLLHYGDALSMANAVESRMPFLDHRLVEYCWTLPAEMKVRAGLGKWIHREAMRGVVPSYILDAKRKLGFTTPIASQFSGGGRSEEDPITVLLSPESRRRGLFDLEALSVIIDRHRRNEVDVGNLLFRMTLVELWYRNFIDRSWH
jgi:asparagine synthase (glutamine-hydrolysing)